MIEVEWMLTMSLLVWLLMIDDCLMLMLRIPASLPSSKSSSNNKRTGSVSQYLKGLADLQTCS